MRLVVLNTWRGALTTECLSFLQRMAADTDVFCFQEVLNGGEAQLSKFWADTKPKNYNLYNDIKSTLTDHVGYFHPHLGAWAGLAIFIKTTHKVSNVGDVFVYKERWTEGDDLGVPPAPRNIQYVTVINENGKAYSVINFHGLWDKEGKGDTPERIAQSRKIQDFIGGIQNPIILCGDFNLDVETKSMKILERGMTNLVTQNAVPTTRTSLYTGSDPIADYVLVSPDVVVDDFAVLPDVVSDHTPLLLAFS